MNTREVLELALEGLTYKSDEDKTCSCPRCVAIRAVRAEILQPNHDCAMDGCYVCGGGCRRCAAEGDKK